MSFSGFGFGHYPFGHFPFGHADYGEDTVVRSFAPTYLEDPTTGEENTLLKHYLYIAKHQANKIKAEIDNLPNQMSVNDVRSDILKWLGSTIAQELDDYEPDEFRRSLVNNAILFYRIKGTADSYRIRGRISGYDVEVVNIYRINQEARVRATVDFLIGTGNGLAAQEFQGTLFTFPIIKSSLKFKINGTVFAQDDGAGNIVTTGGYGITLGTINYGSGDYYFMCTPAPPTSSAIEVDCETGVEGFLVGIGNSANIAFSSTLVPYPIYSTSIKIYVAGVEVARDDGNGNFISTGSYVVTGSVNYRNGVLSLNFDTAPPLAANITASFDKSLLGEFIYCHPDDVYEIPAGTDRWYVTLPPEVIAGNFAEGCGYCLTTYIKLKLTVLKPITIATGSENFFDRLIRKLRDITPIHVRDLLYELQMVVTIDESENLQFQQRQQEEINWLVHSAFHRFDIIPADVVVCDQAGYVSGTVEQV